MPVAKSWGGEVCKGPKHRLEHIFFSCRHLQQVGSQDLLMLSSTSIQNLCKKTIWLVRWRLPTRSLYSMVMTHGWSYFLDTLPEQMEQLHFLSQITLRCRKIVMSFQINFRCKMTAHDHSRQFWIHQFCSSTQCNFISAHWDWKYMVSSILLSKRY